MDTFEFYSTVSAVIFANGLTVAFLYACHRLYVSQQGGEKTSWWVILAGIAPCAIALIGYFFVNPPG